jgi:hypothetical protein
VSDGPFCFGDSSTGYTISYVFRLTDPKARGRRRHYAFVALAGKDPRRAFQACPMLWESFKRMAKGIEIAAQRNQERQREKEEKVEKAAADSSPAGSRAYTPVSSFLTARSTNADGQPRRAGQSLPRNLAEIVGDENIFTFLHQYFVAILRGLGEHFGGTPLTEQPSVFQSTSEEVPRFSQSDLVRQEVHMDAAAVPAPDAEQIQKLRDNDATPKPENYQLNSNKTWPLQQQGQPREDDTEEIEVAKTNLRKSLEERDKNKAIHNGLPFRKPTPQCALPLMVNETAQRRVVV